MWLEATYEVAGPPERRLNEGGEDGIVTAKDGTLDAVRYRI